MAPSTNGDMTSVESPSSVPQPETASTSSDLRPLPLANASPKDGPALPRAASLDTVRPRGLSTTSTTSLKRKPLPSTASPLATRFSSGQHPATTISVATVPARTFFADSPTLPDDPLAPFGSRRDLPEAAEGHPKNHTGQENSDEPPPENAASQSAIPQSPNPAVPLVDPHSLDRDASPPKKSQHARLVSDSELSAASDSTGGWLDDYTSSAPEPSATMSLFSSKPALPNLTLPQNDPTEPDGLNNNGNVTNHKQAVKSPAANKSPGASKLGSFFGWGGNASPVSSTSSSSENAYSPMPSPSLPYGTSPPRASSPSSRPIPAGLDIPSPNAVDDDYFADAYLRTPSQAPGVDDVDDMEEELKAISSELAISIRREMELEDLVERLQADVGASGAGRRTSDYFSDSGVSSVRYGGEADLKSEELEKLQRKTEREKATIRLELTDKVQDERSRRKDLETQIRRLEEKASQVDLHSINSIDTSDRLHELEHTCEDLRRRLSEERQVKENFEDLLSALKSEIQSSQNERDNLRDEIVPQLRARVEGLEADAAEHEKLTYEHSKMLQEMQALRNENSTLMNNAKTRFNTIAEEDAVEAASGLSRSNTIAHGPGKRGSRPLSRPTSLSRSSSVKNVDSRDILVEKVKDIEAQRDALHRALRSLLERQELQTRESEKRIRMLEMERDRALATAPRRMAYDREVAVLREEINTLRRRADDAIEQKWQCEKGLSGLKMDLDRAEQEISSLRSMLGDNDTLTSPSKREHRNSVSSESLEQSYKDLQKSYAASLERIKSFEASMPRDSDTEAALKSLEQSLSAAINERDFALSEVDTLRASVQSLHETERAHLDGEIALAEELRGSAKRVEELACQVRQQLASNSTLRQRLAVTIDRGEKEQKSNIARIALLQGKLRVLEEELVGAQQMSEDRIAAHEEEVRGLKDAHNVQLQRLKDSASGLKSPRLFSPQTPLSPLFGGAGGRSPRLHRTTSGPALSISDEGKVSFLKRRVEELEKALEEADREMEEVVSRMNSAQIEVMQLWNEREEAVRVTRKLEKEIEEERKKGFERRFASLSS
ncbi:MAG: hypothetical protein M1818_008218 [Claussenomyces sp. TS43310]|nr:MAG: hypothetical protein M1818_008218 [Claussenomyces sp. TS43310]